MEGGRHEVRTYKWALYQQDQLGFQLLPPHPCSSSQFFSWIPRTFSHLAFFFYSSIFFLFFLCQPSFVSLFPLFCVFLNKPLCLLLPVPSSRPKSSPPSVPFSRLKAAHLRGPLKSSKKMIIKRKPPQLLGGVYKYAPLR